MNFHFMFPISILNFSITVLATCFFPLHLYNFLMKYYFHSMHTGYGFASKYYQHVLTRYHFISCYKSKLLTTVVYVYCWKKKLAKLELARSYRLKCLVMNI